MSKGSLFSGSVKVERGKGGGFSGSPWRPRGQVPSAVNKVLLLRKNCKPVKIT